MDSFTMFHFEDDISDQCRRRRRDGKGVVNRLQLIVELIQNAAHRYEEVEVSLDDEKAAFSSPQFTKRDLDVARKICEYRDPQLSFAEPNQHQLEKTLPLGFPSTPRKSGKFLDNYDYGLPKENYETSIPYNVGDDYFPAFEKEVHITAKDVDDICKPYSKPVKPAPTSSSVTTILPESTQVPIIKMKQLLSSEIEEAVKRKASFLPAYSAKPKPPKPPKPTVPPPQRKLSPDVKLAQIRPNSMLGKDFNYTPTTSLSSTFDLSKFDRKAYAKAFPDLRKCTQAKIFHPPSNAFP